MHFSSDPTITRASEAVSGFTLREVWMIVVRIAFCALLLCTLSGCRHLFGGGGPSSSDEVKKKAEKDKNNHVSRLPGTNEPENLFPNDQVADVKPRPDPAFKAEDIQGTGRTIERTRPMTTTQSSSPPVIQPPIVVEKPRPMETMEKREPVVEALHCILNGQHNEALNHLREYDQATQDLFLRLLPPIAQLSQKSLEHLNPPEVAVLHETLQTLLTTLRPRTELTIDKMCYCEWVKGYGVYRPVAEGHVFQSATSYTPGELVQLYVELRNVASERRGEYFETKLTSSVEIHDARGEKKWPLRFDEKDPFRTRTLLNDFFNVYSFHVPNLPPGTYLLTVQIADETRTELRRTARRSLEFRVSGANR